MLAQACRLLCPQRAAISLRVCLHPPAMAPKKTEVAVATAAAAGSTRKRSSRAAAKKDAPGPAAAAAEQAAEAAAVVVEAAAAGVGPVLAEEGPGPSQPPAKKKRSGGAKAAKVPAGPVFDHSMRPPPLEGNGFRILSWNVAGIRALLKEEKNVDLAALAEQHGVDVICLQEIKLQRGQQVEDVKAKLKLGDWHHTWNCSTDKAGYSGTAVLSRREPLSVACGIGKAEHDGEGRVCTAEFDDFFVVNAYVPNSGEGLKRLDYRIGSWDKDFSAYLQGLAHRKGVVVAGDLNCAHQELDIHNPKGNLRSAGFTQEERDSFAANLLGQGFVDAFRRQYPGVVGFTYWGYRFNLRAKNAGWRLDYFLVSEPLYEARVHEVYHVPEQLGSDHCPLVLVLKPSQL